MGHLLNNYEKTLSLSMPTVKSAMSSLNAPGLQLTSMQYDNLKKKVKRDWHKMDDSTSETLLSHNEYYNGADELNNILGPAFVESFDSSIHNAVKVSQLVQKEKGSHIHKLMKVLNEEDPFFDFRIYFERKTKEVEAVFWQNGMMRADFERYGSFISIDACKHEWSKEGMIYVSTCTKREDNTIAIVIEGLIKVESHFMVSLMISSLFLMAKSRKKDDVLVVAADGLYNQEFVYRKLELPNARFLLDQWHLVNRNFPENFKGPIFHQIIPHLKSMVYSDSEDEFMSSCQEAREVINNSNGNALHHEYLTYLHNIRETYAKYFISKTMTL